jgi:hypothetical protein
VAAEWSAIEVLVGIEDGKILLEINNGDEELELKMSHELAVSIAEALLAKAAEVEYEISSAVERLTNLG